MNITRRISSFSFLVLVIFSCSWAASAASHDAFLKCLSQEFPNYPSISNIVYTPTNPFYTHLLQFSVWNRRIISESSTPPRVIITPEHESQIPPIVLCAKDNNLEIRTRSGGHDFEGVSFTSKLPFVIMDLINMSHVTVDVEKKTAWVEGGANLGTVYYRIAEKSRTLGFPGGVCPLVGVGGHVSGGGYGALMRKYGLAADNVIDARIVDINGRILDRKSMGEDMFWAIRGGGAASFGVIVAWKLRLVDVPETVTVFRTQRTLEQNATQIINRWQYMAPKTDKDLFIAWQATTANSTRKSLTMNASFFSLFLGRVDRLLPLMQEEFPEMRLTREECAEMSWIESVVFIARVLGNPVDTPESLLNRTQPLQLYLKAKTDYVQTPLPEYVLERLWRFYYRSGMPLAQMYVVPYGGRMDEISESVIPFPHRAGTSYMLANFAFWQEDDNQNSKRHIKWVNRVYNYLTPFVSKSPRAAYINYRDLDIGVNNIRGKTSYEQASKWGKRYFKNNFDRLVGVKTRVDPQNFFRQEQTIPPVHLPQAI